MTREEAINVLENPDVSIGVAARIGQDPEYWRKLKPALDMAIAALREQEGKDTYAPTNADRIRAMSDEELVEFIKHIKVRAAFCKAVKDNDAFEALCSAEWLQMPAEEDKYD